MNRITILAIMFVLLTIESMAQTVCWQMEPTNEYQEIKRISKNIYRVCNNGKTGLVNADGTIVEEISNSSLTGFYNNIALMTRQDEQGELILGCLLEDGEYHHFTKRFYTLKGQNFYSCGLLSVMNDKGNLGYIDIYGNEIVGFDGAYSRIKPFSEDFAVVFDKKKSYHLIDKEGNQVRFSFKDGFGIISGGTNVYNGVVYVIDAEGDVFECDVTSGLQVTCNKTKKIKKHNVDYLYRYSQISGANKEIPFRKSSRGDIGISPVRIGNTWGFANNQNTILPSQFQHATEFEDGYSIVTMPDGKIGILKYVHGTSFNVSVENSEKAFYNEKSIDVSFNINIPPVWDNKPLSIKVLDDNIVIAEFNGTENNYNLSVGTAKTHFEKKYSIIVTHKELTLYEANLEYKFIKKCNTCKKDIDKCIYRGNHPLPEEEEICKFCNKKISECKYGGVHDKE